MMRALFLALVVHSAAGVGSLLSARSWANPIRRVVTMLDSILAKVEAEGDAEKKSFDKFMCYCKNGKGDLEASVSAGDAKVPELDSSIASLQAEQQGLSGDLQQAKTGRAEAERSLADGKAVREKEAAASAAALSNSQANIAALEKAIAALEKGVADAFLQSPAASTLQRVAESADLGSTVREVLASFLGAAGGAAYPPQSGEIVGILKQLKDTFEGSQADEVSAEEEAKKAFEELAGAKTKEIQALTKEVEGKTERAGEIGVDLVNAKYDLEDTQKALEQDKAMIEQLTGSCASKDGEWVERSKLREEEVLAIHETIKTLNNDDALSLFKQTLPGTSFLQMPTGTKEMKQRALAALKAHGSSDLRLDLVAVALRGNQKGSFSKVITMIDDMSTLLGKEQTDNDAKKAYCTDELDTTEDELKGLGRETSDLEKATEERKSAADVINDEMATLVEGVKKLDEDVAESTAQRKADHAEFQEELASKNSASELLGLAKDRMLQFYNAKLAKPTEPSLAEIAFKAMGGAESEAAQEPAPETWGEYKKKGQASAGVVALLDALVADLAKEMAVMQVEEKKAQAEYESFISAAANKRATDAKEVTTKEGTKAELEATLEKLAEETKSTKAEFLAKSESLHVLHGECDWFLQNYDVRKEARASEVESLKSAEAVLSGADYSLLQVATVEHHGALPEEANFNKIAPFGKEDTARELQDHAATTQNTLVDAVENAEVAEIKRAVFRALTRLRAATIKEFDTIARLETQSIDAYNDAHHYRAENPLAHLHEDEAPVETDKLKSFH